MKNKLNVGRLGEGEEARKKPLSMNYNFVFSDKVEDWYQSKSSCYKERLIRNNEREKAKRKSKRETMRLANG